MIAHLTGSLVSASPSCVVTVGGVGFEVQVAERDRSELMGVSGEVSFHTYLYVREDRLTLFGFLRPEDRELFTRLIEVSGIGPRIALNMLGEYPTARIVQAIRNSDHTFLCRLPGLGRKTAQRVTVELKDKLDHLDIKQVTELPGVSTALREEALLALATLGMTRNTAEEALEKIDWSADDAPNLATIVKQALKNASGA